MAPWARPAWISAWALIVVLSAAATSHAQPESAAEPAAELVLAPAPSLGPLAGRPIVRIDVVTEGGRWSERVTPRRVRVGEPLTPEVARRALRELTDTGRYAAARAEAEPLGEGVLLRLLVLPRRLAAAIRVVGGVVDFEETLRAAGVREGSEVTAPELPRIAARLRSYYARRGFPRALVQVTTQETDDPLRVVVAIEVQSGSPHEVVDRWFGVSPDPALEGLRDVLAGYEIDEGDRADEEALDSADRALAEVLHTRGWQRAEVGHRLERVEGGARLHVLVRAGPLVRLRFEGNRRFDATQLEEALELEDGQDRAVPTLVERLRDFYVARGFLDVEVTASERGAQDAPIHELVFRIAEQAPVRVVAREYPCLTGTRTAAQVGSEIDSFLSEELPGGELLEPVDPAAVDKLFGPRQATGARVAAYEPNPWLTYVPDVYERAMKHVQDLYRSEGYLSASVGPAQLLRRRCHPRSPPGRCIVLAPRRRPRTQCAYDEIGLPLEEPPPDDELSCVPDPGRGVRCEPDVVLHVPIKLGPRTELYDLAFEGNRALVENELLEEADLQLGDPVSQLELEKARRRLMDAYAELGFAFANVDVELDLSPDHTRGRARFVISEREQVVVSGIVIRGARATSESLIRSRIALEVGQPYRRSLVRQTEERLATLGVFSTITVGFEDPYVPAREKVVIVTVVERKPQYLDIKPGFSTGEGFRITFEYGHRNLGGEAIQLTLRSQLGYLPSAFIFEEEVRRRFDELNAGERLERRNTATLEFPDIGLGPLFRLSVEALDVRDNARDFGMNKDAGIVTLIFRPERRFSAQLGTSLELNNVEIFEPTPLIEFLRANPTRVAAIRVPTGTTVVFAQRIGASWDRRDNPLGATRGTFLSAGVEHVHAYPIADELTEEEKALKRETEETPFEAVDSDFLRYTNRIAGYVPLDEEGLALALSFRWGFIQHLITGSRTYPDRLFFMGGIDSLRSHLQDSMVPEDLAEQILDPTSGVTLEQIVIRGGDVFLNPRAELRIPLTSSVQTAFFVDAGNLWTDPEKIDPFELRYAAGTGLRIATPIGPLVFDYGFNLHRILDELELNPGRRRSWEDLGAFHFSIGLF